MVRELREKGQVSSTSWLLHLPRVLWILFRTFLAITVETIYTLITCCFAQPRDLKEKVIIVTGSGRGLGRDISLTLARKGAFLACVDINEKNNTETVSMIKSEGGKAQGFTVNVAKYDQIQKLVDDVKNTLGPVDILVNNAGLIHSTKMEDYTEKDIRVQFEVNTFSLAYFLTILLPDMKKRKDCQIVAVSSLSAKFHMPYISIYGATKAAISAMMNSVRLEQEMEGNPSNLTISTVHPFFINTSADYMELLDIGLPILEPSTVVDSVLKTIQYRYKEVDVPSFFGHLFNLSMLLPQSTNKHALTIARPKMTLQDRTYWNNLPYGTIRDKTIPSGS